jgi:hypothetical protein
MMNEVSDRFISAATFCNHWSLGKLILVFSFVVTGTRPRRLPVLRGNAGAYRTPTMATGYNVAATVANRRALSLNTKPPPH